jgi:signal recognition particle GTPase
MYRKQIAQLIEMDKFTLVDFRAQIETAAAEGGATGWKSNIPGASSQPMVKEVQQQLKVFAAFNEEEMKDYEKLRRREKLRVSEESGASVQMINTLIEQYEHSCALHHWLKQRHAAGLPLPQSMDEATTMAQNDRRFLKQPGKRSRAGKQLRKRGR